MSILTAIIYGLIIGVAASPIWLIPKLGSRTKRALHLAAVALIAVLVVPGHAQAAPPRTPRANRYAIAVFHLINRERVANGLQPLWHCSMLRLSARRHDWRMAQADTLSHQLPGEPMFTQREWNAGYHWVWAGENVAWNSDMTRNGALELERVMYGEYPPNDEHRVNILSPHYRAVGVDVLLDRTHHRLWLTVDFGRRY